MIYRASLLASKGTNHVVRGLLWSSLWDWTEAGLQRSPHSHLAPCPPDLLSPGPSSPCPDKHLEQRPVSGPASGLSDIRHSASESGCLGGQRPSQPPPALLSTVTSVSPACHPFSLKPHGSDSWDSRAPRKPSSIRESQGQEVPLPPPSPISGSQGQQHMLLPSGGEKLLSGSFPSSTAAQGMRVSLFWGGLRIITDPIQGLPAGLTNGTDKGERKKNKGGGWKGCSFGFH